MVFWTLQTSSKWSLVHFHSRPFKSPAIWTQMQLQRKQWKRHHYKRTTPGQRRMRMKRRWLKSAVKKKRSSCNEHPQGCYLILRQCRVMTDADHLIGLAYKFLLTLFITKVACGRTFSALKFIKKLPKKQTLTRSFGRFSSWWQHVAYCGCWCGQWQSCHKGISLETLYYKYWKSCWAFKAG